MKNIKAYGVFRVPSEHIKLVVPHVASLLTDLTNQVCREVKLSDDLKSSMTIMIIMPKKEHT